MARLRVQGETCVVPPGVAQEKSMEGSLAEVAFTIQHYYITTSRTDSFGANISRARIMVLRLHREDADEAYESYMDARVTGGSSSGTDKASTVRTMVSGERFSEDTVSSCGADPVVDTKDEVEVEEESVRKRKSKGVSSDCSLKKAKGTVSVYNIPPQKHTITPIHSNLSNVRSSFWHLSVSLYDPNAYIPVVAQGLASLAAR
ncbi:hypothetical protein EDD18DRAFT_1357257 [Armillaria luteobubalina]|uniref:Uncharacterized protein n=1 Tax=Armillaria luteobubalina TaxID=153913 RepID=A0AA39PYH4_9AGAR|nr:hypothetical protein EDD18DRAFT_1357257 [Armillaria luteobubalina]